MIIGAGAALATAPAAVRARGTAPDWFTKAIIIDGLGDVGDPYRSGNDFRLSRRAWAEMAGSGVTVLRDTVRPVGNVKDPWGEYGRSIAEKLRILIANPDRLRLVRSVADIQAAKRDRRFGVLLGTQDTVMIGDQLDRLAHMKADGIMTVQLTYNRRNLAGDGALEPANAGLTPLGKAMIERIEAERLLLDLSHGGARTMAEATALAKRPLVISHTGAKALHDHPRNTDDATIRAVAEKGGVVGVYFMPFLTANGEPSASDLIAHIEHVANVAGEDHVGIGTDNGVLPLDSAAMAREDKTTEERIQVGIAAPGEVVGIYPMVRDYNSVDRYARLAADLGGRGWSVSRLEKLFGLNFLRTYREAWEG